MSPVKTAVTTCEIYDQALKYCRDFRLPPGTPQPCYTSEWLSENIAAIERYREWLSSGGASESVIKRIYIPMAGHVLGLNHKPSAALDLERDLPKAMEYIHAKGHGPDWTDVCRVALEKFRRFLMHERGQIEIKWRPFEVERYAAGLPDWLVGELLRYQRIQERNWREARLEENILRFWSGHVRLWRFLVEQCGVQELSDVKRKHLADYVDFRLADKKAVRGINGDLRSFHSFMGFLQEQGFPVAHALLHVPCLKEPDALPKFLPDEQVKKLRDDHEERVTLAKDARDKRDALLDRAIFYLLWQGGLRKGEVEELRLDDLDLTGKRLTVRRGKGMTDRTVYLTDSTREALKAYLAVRGMGPTEHVFLYRNQPLSKDLISGRLKMCGERTGVKVHAHRLRHTCATQLLNAGCRVTSIQKFLGHKRLNTTMIYARAHDQTVENDYFLAMASVEKRLDLLGEPVEEPKEVEPAEREQLLTLVTQLSMPDLSLEQRMEIALRMRTVLTGNPLTRHTSPICERRQPDVHPPPSLSILGQR